MAICQAMLTRDEGMNGTFFSSIVIMDDMDAFFQS
jgi:hypothetical protein